jgi:hypothetical protein
LAVCEAGNDDEIVPDTRGLLSMERVVMGPVLTGKLRLRLLSASVGSAVPAAARRRS